MCHIDQLEYFSQKNDIGILIGIAPHWYNSAPFRRKGRVFTSCKAEPQAVTVQLPHWNLKCWKNRNSWSITNA